jgi:PAS domain S-box-containing protein
MSLGLLDNESLNRSNSADLTDTLAAYVALVNREGFIEFAGQCEGGLTPDRLVGHKVFDRVPSEVRQILTDKLERVFETNAVEFIHMPAPADCNNGGAIEIRLVPLVESGKPLQTVAVAFRRTLMETKDDNRLADPAGPLSRVTLDELPCERSLKERQLIEVALQQSEERFRQIAETSLQGIVIVQHDRVVYTNPAAAALTECTSQELTGASVASVTERFIDSDSLELVRAKLKNTNYGMPHRSSYEIKVHTTTGRTRWIEVAAMPVTYEGAPAIQVALIDATIRKEAEEALRNSEERYRTLVENAQNAIFSMEYDGTIVFMNSVAGGMLGGEAKNFVGKNVKDLFPPDKAVRHLAAVQRVIDSGKGETIENLTELQGEPRWHITSIHPLNGHDAQASSAFMISTDITESKLAAQKLARERDFTRMILQTANSLIFCLDKDARILLFNEECERVTGYSSEEVIGKRWPDIFMPERYRHYGLEDFGAWVYQHPADRREEPILTKSGGERIILWSNSSFVHPDTGEITAIAIGYDITEARQVGQRLKETESRFRSLVEGIPALTYTAALDATSTTTYISPQVETLLGYTPDEYMANPDIWERLLHPDDRDRVLAEVQRCHRTGERFLSEYRMIHRNGNIVWFRDQATFLHDESGKPICLQGIQYDITESKAALEKLRESEGRFKELADLLPQTVFEFDTNGKFTFINRSGFEAFGRTPEELEKGANVADALHPDDRERAWQNVISLGIGCQSTGNEYTAIRGDGTQFPVLAYTTRICHNGEVVGYRGILLDITARKQAEQALRQSQEAFRDLVENVDDVLYTTDGDLVITYVSPVVKKVLGYDSSELLGRSALSLVYSEDLPTIQAAVQDVLNGSLYPSEYRMIAKTSEVRWVRSLSRPIFEGGTFMGVRGVLADIHKRKLTEQALRDSQKRFERVAQQSREMVWEVNADGLFTYVSQASDEILGYRPEEMIGTMHFYDLQPEEEREKFKLASQEQIAKRESFHNQLNKAITKTGQVVWFLTSGAPVMDEQGNLKGYIGADLDITERKQAEEALREKDEFLSSIIENIPDMIFVKDAEELRFVRFNEAGEELLGYQREDLIGKNDYDIFPREQADSFTRKDREVLETGQLHEIPEESIETKHGRRILHTKKIPIVEKDGKSTFLLGISHDITDRKHAQEALRESEERFRALYRGSPLPTYTWQWNGSDFVLIDHNEAASKVTETSIRNYLGLTADKLYENRPDCIQDIQLCYENQATINREMKYTYLSTGKTLELAVRYTFVPPNFVLVVTEDITQRKRDEEALRMSEERFRALYNGSPLPMALFQWKDGDLQLVNCNEATNSISHRTLPNLVGSPAKNILSQEPEFLETIYECFHKQTAVNVDYSHQLWNSDEQLCVSVFAAFIPPDLLLIQSQDITERRRMEEALRSTNELLAQERHALLDKNIALKEVLGQSKDEANQVKQNVQSNIDKLILPILVKLKEKAREGDRIDLDLLESLMSDVASPFLRDIESRFVQLTPRETEICSMIRNGLQSKEIGLALGISVRTVEKFRQKIRDKLRVESRDTNLTTFLRAITQRR